MFRALGESMTEPKGNVWFEQGDAPDATPERLVLDRRTRMLYDARHVYINGEAFVAGGRDARLMRCLADRRQLSALDCAALGEEALALLDEWAQSGWLHGDVA